MDTRQTASPSRAGERGVALLLGLLFTIVVSGICLSGTLLLQAHMRTNRTSWASKSQALQVARSGLAEAHSWLRRQTSQPVLAFAPQLNTAATPQILDTIDQDIGLVREFRISGETWARYEVWKRWDADPDAARLAWRQQFQCEDISIERSGASLGSIWRLRSIGYIYHRASAAVPYNQLPNRVIASQVAVNEYRRVVISLPGAAAINIENGNGCFINNMGRAIGGTGGAIYHSTGTPTLAGGSTVTGGVGVAVGYDDSYERVFGMSYDQVRAIATSVITTAAAVPSPMPTNGLIIIDAGAVSIGAAKPLLGTAIVIVRGDLTLTIANNSNFNGLLFVEGNLVVRQPSLIKGSVICTGTLTVEGGAEFATIEYDGNVLSALMNHIGNYTASNSTMLPRLAR